jgi:hypothetical protein
MRVRFFAPTDEAETRDFLRLGERIGTFWRRFGEFGNDTSPERLRAVRSLLSEIHPGLAIDLLQRSAGRRVGVVRHREQLQLRPLAELIVASAPRIEDWSFTVERPRRALEEALTQVSAQEAIDLKDASLRLGIARGHAFEVVLKSHHFTGSEDARGLGASQLLLSLLLGDRAFDTWIGSISILPGPRPSKLKVLGETQGEPERFVPLADLVPAFDAGIAGIDAGLSEEPYHRYCERAEWTLLDVEPESGHDDYVAQDDLAFCSTMLPEMLKCFLQGDLFASRRFSKHGEVFAYLKYQSSFAEGEARLSERQALEDLLNRALVPGALGCVVGGGLGIRYSYVDFALHRLDLAIPLIRRVLKEQASFRVAWILFCDSSLRDEWVAIDDGMPPPPLSYEGVEAC